MAARAAVRPASVPSVPVRGRADDSFVDVEMEKLRTSLEKAGLSKDNFSWAKLNQAVSSNPEVLRSVKQLRSAMSRNAPTISSGLVVDAESKAPVRVTVTGASGAIGYATLFRIANGEMLGKDQPVILQLLELPQALKSLEGVVMELNDCAFPLLKGVVQTDSPEKAFEGSQYALLIGAKPRTKGMERADLLKGNAEIFKVQGKAINATASRDIKVVVVGNPANTNALICASHASSLSPKQFTAMTRLDHNRGLAQLSEKAKVGVEQITRFAIWGNHSPTMYPDISHSMVGDKPLKSLINDEKWVRETFIPTVAQRGTAIINARGASSAASAGSSAIDHMRDWVHGTSGQWTSMGVVSDGSYGTTPGLMFSFPVTCDQGNWSIVQNVPVDQFSAGKISATDKELKGERDAVASMLA